MNFHMSALLSLSAFGLLVAGRPASKLPIELAEQFIVKSANL
jgi:hypothetical protein